MTFRIYVRQPNQRMTEKTTTDGRAVAELAFRELESNAIQLISQGAFGISYTDNRAQIEYVSLCEEHNQKALSKP